MYCRKCGFELKENACFCGKCGTKINLLSSQQQVNKQQAIPYHENKVNDDSDKKDKGNIVIIVMITIALIVIMVVVFIFIKLQFFDNKNNSSNIVDSHRYSTEAVLGEDNLEDVTTTDTDDTLDNYLSNQDDVTTLPEDDNSTAEQSTTEQSTTEQISTEQMSSDAYSGLYEGFVFPDSDRVLLTDMQIKEVVIDYSISRLAINEIYARYGYAFKKENYIQIFSQYEWYSNMPKITDADEVYKLLSPIETDNLNKLIEYERQMGWRE